MTNITTNKLSPPPTLAQAKGDPVLHAKMVALHKSFHDRRVNAVNAEIAAREKRLDDLQALRDSLRGTSFERDADQFITEKAGDDKIIAELDARQLAATAKAEKARLANIASVAAKRAEREAAERERIATLDLLAPDTTPDDIARWERANGISSQSFTR